MPKPPDRKSPIQDLPRRTPGQSLQQQIDDIFNDQLLPWLMVPFITWVLVILETARWLFKFPVGYPTAIGMAIGASLFTFLSVIKIRNLRPKLHNLRQGLEGEIFIGQFLDEYCRERGYKVIHDLQADGFNVDHVLIGPGGIFSIETKTISKPAKGRAVVQYNGTSLLIDGHTPDRDPIIQSKACASHIANTLSRSTARRADLIPIRPVVLYPGWYVETRSQRPPVWVLNPKAFLSFLDYQESLLSPEDIALFHTRLEPQTRPPSK